MGLSQQNWDIGSPFPNRKDKIEHLVPSYLCVLVIAIAKSWNALLFSPTMPSLLFEIIPLVQGKPPPP